MRAASTRAASTNCGSLSSTSACSGVLVRCRLTVQKRRSAASKLIADGGGDERFHTV